MSSELEDLREQVKLLEQRLTRLEEAVKSEVLSNVLESLQDRDKRRNKSSPTTRDMTDKDAMAVLTGEIAELGHKEAAVKVGLTYAQVYSCRMGYTFKHVHKELKQAGIALKWNR